MVSCGVEFDNEKMSVVPVVLLCVVESGLAIGGDGRSKTVQRLAGALNNVFGFGEVPVGAWVAEHELDVVRYGLKASGHS